MKNWGIACRDTGSSDMFLPRLAFSGTPGNVEEGVMRFLFY